MAAAKAPARASAPPGAAAPAAKPAKPELSADRRAFRQGYQQAGGSTTGTRQDFYAGLGGAAGAADSAAGFVLGALAWVWVGLPLLKGGPAEVRRVLMAKFLNKSPDGKWLP